MISNELKSQIQGAYTRFLEAKSLKPRYGQRLMIAEVAKVLGAIECDDEAGAAVTRRWWRWKPVPVPARRSPTAWLPSPLPRPPASAW
jgi:hypothetical protein